MSARIPTPRSCSSSTEFDFIICLEQRHLTSLFSASPPPLPCQVNKICAASYIRTNSILFCNQAASFDTMERAPEFIKYHLFKVTSMQIFFNFIISAAFTYIGYNSIIKLLHSKNKFKTRSFFILYSLSRYLRPLPVILAMVLINLSLPIFSGTLAGPVFQETMANVTGNCHERAWVEPLGISNFIYGRSLVSNLLKNSQF